MEFGSMGRGRLIQGKRDRGNIETGRRAAAAVAGAGRRPRLGRGAAGRPGVGEQRLPARAPAAQPGQRRAGDWRDSGQGGV
jgi:hypothetical protein